MRDLGCVMSRLVSDILILVGIIIGVHLIAEGQVDFGGLARAASDLHAPELPFAVHIPSAALGLVGGLALGLLASVRWGQLPRRIVAWFREHSARFSYVGLSLGFAIVLLYY